MEKLSDISLVTKVVMLHDRKSFDLLVKKYQSPIRGFFLRQTLGDAQLSDDLAQDTFVKTYTHLGSFKGTANFSTWLYRIAVMPVMFIPAAVGLIDSWQAIGNSWMQYIVVTVVSTFVVMGVAGWITQMVIRKNRIKAQQAKAAESLASVEVSENKTEKEAKK